MDADGAKSPATAHLTDTPLRSKDTIKSPYNESASGSPEQRKKKPMIGQVNVQVKSDQTEVSSNRFKAGVALQAQQPKVFELEAI